MFEKLDNRYFFTGEIVLSNELHIGSGKGDEKTDALVVKDFKGNPYIPGSSLRGALRSTIERIIGSLNLKPCLLIKDSSCVTNSKTLQEEFKKIDKNAVEINKFLSADNKVCPVCKLFGSPVVASKIRITDLAFIGDNPKTSVRDGVAIDRDTETAKEGAKFDFEVVAKESRFQFEIIGENLHDRDLALLAIGLQEIMEGNFWLGGNTARGLGKCKLEKLKIEFFQGAEGLKKYITNKEMDPMTHKSFFNKINDLFKSN